MVKYENVFSVHIYATYKVYICKYRSPSFYPPIEMSSVLRNNQRRICKLLLSARIYPGSGHDQAAKSNWDNTVISF